MGTKANESISKKQVISYSFFNSSAWDGKQQNSLFKTNQYVGFSNKLNENTLRSEALAVL